MQRVSASAPADLVGSCAAAKQQHTRAGRTLLPGLLSSLHGHTVAGHSVCRNDSHSSLAGMSFAQIAVHHNQWWAGETCWHILHQP